jgi:hypothetical protein
MTLAIIREKRPLEEGAVAAPAKESMVESGFLALPTDMLEKIISYLNDTDLLAMAQVNGAIRKIALTQRVVRVHDAIPTDLRQYFDLTGNRLNMRPSPLRKFCRFILEEHAQRDVVGWVTEFRQEAVALATQDVLEECKVFKRNLKTRINTENLSFEDIDRSVNALEEELVEQKLIAIMRRSTFSEGVRREMLDISAESGCVHIVRALLANGAISAESRGFIVMKAAERGHLAVVQELLANGAISESHRGVALDKAAEGGHLAVMQELVIGREDWRGRAVIIAARRGHLAIVEALLANGAIVEEERAKAITLAAGPNQGAIRLLLQGACIIGLEHFCDLIFASLERSIAITLQESEDCVIEHHPATDLFLDIIEAIGPAGTVILDNGESESFMVLSHMLSNNEITFDAFKRYLLRADAAKPKIRQTDFFRIASLRSTRNPQDYFEFAERLILKQLTDLDADEVLKKLVISKASQAPDLEHQATMELKKALTRNHRIKQIQSLIESYGLRGTNARSFQDKEAFTISLKVDIINKHKSDYQQSRSHAPFALRK